MERKWLRRLLILALAVLVVGACCYWSGFWWYVPPLAQMWANHLDRVQGKAELLVPAQWRPGRVRLSPDGRKMVIEWRRRGQEEVVVWDLVTGEQHPLDLDVSSLRWLNSEQFIVFDASNGYYLVNAPDLSVTPVDVFPREEYKRPGGFEVIEPWLREAERVYDLDIFVIGRTLVVLDEKFQYVFYLHAPSLGLTDEKMAALVAEIPHADVPKFGWGVPTLTNERVYSPDGQFYTARVGADGEARVVIYTRDGKLVAEAYKGGWGPSIRGWAHDSSGVYFQMIISGSSAVMLVPYGPLFKLSPLSEEEARQVVILRVVKWVSVGLVLAGVGYIIVRRRRAGEERVELAQAGCLVYR